MNIALIVGCARSGTSILGELVGSHPDVKYIFEAHSIWEMAGYGENESHRLTEEKATPQIVATVREWFSKQQDSAVLLVEKNPRNVLRIPFITKIFPEARIIHVVRDGRDVACSLLPGIGGEDWMHLKPPSWKQFIQEIPIIRCAKVWREVLGIALNDLQKVPHLTVKYEDLVLRNKMVAMDILRYLRLQVHENVSRLCEKIQNATANSYNAQHQVVWFKDDHQSRIGRWRENLSLKEQETVQAIQKDLLVRLGYPLVSNYADVPYQ